MKLKVLFLFFEDESENFFLLFVGIDEEMKTIPDIEKT